MWDKLGFVVVVVTVLVAGNGGTQLAGFYNAVSIFVNPHHTPFEAILNVVMVTNLSALQGLSL